VFEIIQRYAFRTPLSEYFPGRSDVNIFTIRLKIKRKKYFMRKETEKKIRKFSNLFRSW
jgi:hypothetical protein